MISLWVILAGGNYDLNLFHKNTRCYLVAFCHIELSIQTQRLNHIFEEGPSGISDLKVEAGMDKNI
jgi:hypothetical protein